MSNNPNNIFNIEYEKFVLSAMLLKDGEIIPDVAAILQPEDFYRPEHRIVFNAILKIYAQKQPVNILTLVNELRSSNKLDDAGTDFVFSLTEIAHTTAYADFYAKAIKEKALSRSLLDSLRCAAEDIKSGTKNPLDIIADSQAAFSALSSRQNPKIVNVCQYFLKNFLSDIDKLKQYNNRKTGFWNIDEFQIFSAGLYVLGATPACGKTTFAWQLAEQLANNGEDCIFCSYEMSTLELSSKSVSRDLFLQYDKKFSAAQIRRGAWTNDISDVISYFITHPINLRVIELQNETVDDLLKLLRPLCSNVQKAPVVFIDYLQIIPSDKDNPKQGIDDTVRKLKLFQRDTGTTFFLISSFNRTNYLAPVSFESFKESGNIEYTADVIWGLQLDVMNNLSGGIIENRKQIDEARKQQPRQIHLKCLKNRQGNNYDCYFLYFSAYDYFEPYKLPVATESVKKDSAANNDDKISD